MYKRSPFCIMYFMCVFLRFQTCTLLELLQFSLRLVCWDTVAKCQQCQTESVELTAGHSWVGDSAPK